MASRLVGMQPLTNGQGQSEMTAKFFMHHYTLDWTIEVLCHNHARFSGSQSSRWFFSFPSLPCPCHNHIPTSNQSTFSVSNTKQSENVRRAHALTVGASGEFRFPSKIAVIMEVVSHY